jgi:tyrosinase
MDQSSASPPAPAKHGTASPRQEDVGLSRRDFMRLVALATAVGATGLPLSLSACGNLSSVTNVAQRPVRREITTADAGTIASFKKAVTWMQNMDLPSSPTYDPNTQRSKDPRSWINQAEIHNTKCRHGSWLFFPWHRAYLYYFEQICRVGSGDPNFALPYWNWSITQQIPPAFTSGSLNDSTRVANPAFFPHFAVDPGIVNGILAQLNFLVFAGAQTVLNDPNQHGPGAGQVEGTPHNNIHGWVGGDMGAFMSPLDPIFWAHHNMVDQLWVQWNILLNNPNTNSSDWWDTKFTDFVDGNGNPATITVLDTVIMPFYSYKFDTQP